MGKRTIQSNTRFCGSVLFPKKAVLPQIKEPLSDSSGRGSFTSQSELSLFPQKTDTKPIIEAWFDGACGPKNPGGIASYGIIIKSRGKLVHTATGRVGRPPDTSNNLAEHAGLRAILQWLLDNHYDQTPIHVYGDSCLVINQILGTKKKRKGKVLFGYWKIKGGTYMDVALENKKLHARFKEITGSWIPREQNTECDLLSKSL